MQHMVGSNFPKITTTHALKMRNMISFGGKAHRESSSRKHNQKAHEDIPTGSAKTRAFAQATSVDANNAFAPATSDDDINYY
jgi:hypothetical protein